MAEKRLGARFFEARLFGLVIGLLVFGILALFTFRTAIIQKVEQKILDINFVLKNSLEQSRVQEGVSIVQRNPKISPDILIVGIDDRALTRFGKWPFPRYRHADLIDAFSHIKNQDERERALFLDVFFTEPDREAQNDARLLNSISESGRVFLETVLQTNAYDPGTEQDSAAREAVLTERLGSIRTIEGDWRKVATWDSVLPPLKPYGRVAHGYGNVSLSQDPDEVFRSSPIVAKLPELIKEIRLDDLTVDEPVNDSNFERLAWMDKDGVEHDVAYPLTASVLSKLKADMERTALPRTEDTNNDGKPDSSYFVVRKYRDTMIPAITLSLALEYFHKTLADIQVVLGKYVLIPAPQQFDTATGQWGPYKIELTPPQYDADNNLVKNATYRDVPEIRIPIDASGSMLINYMGYPSVADTQGHQTYPIRSYVGYAGNPPSQDPQKWPATKKVGNSIVMVGIFAQGLAEDQKMTPFGLMYGVEIHANALNTILMENFIRPAEPWVTALILFGMIMLTAFMVSRLSALWSLAATIAAVLVYVFAGLYFFDAKAYVLTLSSPVVGAILSFLAVVAYRTMTEEKDKRRIRDMFGKYVSPSVVEEILQNPPELGGVDKELTVMFSDIRGFTNLSESMNPQELVNHLNTYLTGMTDVILEYEGTLDKYVGDEIMCFWGAPLPQDDHALRACRCALRQIEVLRDLNAQWPPEKRLSIGIGINSGVMTVGNMGSLGRMNYTLTGDNVNLGSRLEGTNKQYYTTIIMSEYTYHLVKDSVVARELDNIRVKGKNKPVLIYELVDITNGGLTRT